MSHWLLPVKRKFIKHDIVEPPHPLYSPDFESYYFYLFLWMKGCHFKDAVEVQVALNIALQKVVCGGCELCVHWQKCVAVEGQYFKDSCI